MTHTPAQIFRQYLLDEGLAVEPGASGSWPIYHSHLPDGVGVEDDALCVYDTAGGKDGRPMGGLPLFHHGIQLRVRSRSYTDGWEKAQEIADAAGGILRESLDLDSITYIIQSVSQSTSVVALGVEEEGTKRRDHFTVNFLATLKEE